MLYANDVLREEDSRMRTEDYIMKQERLGKKVLILLVVVNIILFTTILLLSLASGIYNNLVGNIVMIILCLFIYSGGQISKWIFVIINTLNISALLFSLLMGDVVSKAPYVLNVFTVIMLIVSVVSCIVLIFSKSVNEYMYKQKTK